VKPILADLGLRTLGTEAAWAVTSHDDRFRYLLGREWNPERPLWCVCMINPSRARHDIPDHTITKLCGFGSRRGAGGFIVVNVLPYSATDPDDMVAAHRAGVDVRGEYNDAAIRWAKSKTAHRVAAWGKIPKVLKLLAQQGEIDFVGPETECFGVNADDSPRHPLMLGYDTPLVKLTDAREALRAGFKNGLRPEWTVTA
jgi:hypothetical protein